MAGKALRDWPTAQLIDEQSALLRRLQAVSVEVARRAAGEQRGTVVLTSHARADLPGLAERAETLRGRFGLVKDA